MGQGAQIQLQLASPEEEPVARYAGTIELAGRSHAIAVEIAPSDTAADGLKVSASAPDLPPAIRAKLERLSAAMARSAVRRARKDGMRPPHRIRRWREV